MYLSLFYSCRHHLTSSIAIVCTATILTIASNSPGLAQFRLLPTDINTGDCVAANISTVKTAPHRVLDRQYCTAKNSGNPQKTQVCQQNLAERTGVTFFTDRCPSDDRAGKQD
jgi:hypothetical protein